jgi:hypothetical protein
MRRNRLKESGRMVPKSERQELRSFGKMMEVCCHSYRQN